jgi:hypothetical protein
VADHKWSLLCYRACIDKYTNLLSILDVTEEITVQEAQTPIPENAALPVSIQLVSMWYRSNPAQPEKFWQTLTVTLPNGDIFKPGKALEGNLEEHSRIRLLLGVQAIPFTGPGRYVFNVTVSNSPDGPFEEVVAEVPLEIKVSEEVASAILQGQPPAAPQVSSSPREPSPPSRRPTSPKRRQRGSS